MAGVPGDLKIYSSDTVSLGQSSNPDGSSLVLDSIF